MKPPEYLDVDPAELRLPPSRFQGADPVKLHRQIVKFGNSLQGMPPIFVYRGSDGVFQIVDGVTRAVRAAKTSPGNLVRVEVVRNRRFAYGPLPKVGDRVP